MYKSERFYSLQTRTALTGMTAPKARVNYGVPSVTTIEKIVNKFQLNKWLVETSVRYALKNFGDIMSKAKGSLDDGSVYENAIEIVNDYMDGEGSSAATRGTEIHDTISEYLLGNPLPSVLVVSKETQEKVIENLSGWMAEKRMAGWEVWKIEHPFARVVDDGIAYGGRIDLILRRPVADSKSREVFKYEYMTVDFKSQKKNKSGYNFYTEWPAQLAAYTKAMVPHTTYSSDGTYLVNVIVDAEDGSFHERDYSTPEKKQAAWDLFERMALLWYMYEEYPIDDVIKAYNESMVNGAQGISSELTPVDSEYNSNILKPQLSTLNERPFKSLNG